MYIRLLIFLEVDMKKGLLHYFSHTEILLWCFSVFFITDSFIIFDNKSYMTLTASIISVTSLIFNAKGNPAGQFLMIIFSIMYAVLSFTFTYYGEMIIYLGMTAPMAVFALIIWLRNPYNGNKAQVRINRLKHKELFFLPVLTAVVTLIFYFVLKAFNTANLLPSTLSVTTSFIAAYLTFRRSAYFALAYAANDIVLIVLWTMAAINDISYLSVIICFIMFLINDIYGFINWVKMRKHQKRGFPL